MIKIIGILIMLWNYVFERSFNLFDVAMFGYIWQAGYSWTDWQFWTILVIGTILSAIGHDINRKFKEFRDL